MCIFGTEGPEFEPNYEKLWICNRNIIRYHCHHQSVLPKGRSFTANSGTKAAVLPKGRSSTANSGTKVAVLLGMNRCDSFPLLSAPHSLFSIWTDLKRYEKIPGTPVWRWGEWIWLTGPSGLYQNSSQGLNISSIRDFDQVRDPEIPIYHHQSALPEGRSFIANTGTKIAVCPKADLLLQTQERKLQFYYA